jgi:hypothetical protein
MTSIAGDLYDYILAEGGRAGLLIADVSYSGWRNGLPGSYFTAGGALTFGMIGAKSRSHVVTR